MSSSPGARKAPPRPKIQLPLPGQFYPQPGMGYVPTPYGQTPIPMTPVSGQPQMVYSNRASEFVFSQFKGIKHLTKSGLSVGEKSAFWLYEKYRRRDDLRDDRGNARGRCALQHPQGEKHDADNNQGALEGRGARLEFGSLEWTSEEASDGVRGALVRVLQARRDGSWPESVVLLERCLLLWHHLHHHRSVMTSRPVQITGPSDTEVRESWNPVSPRYVHAILGYGHISPSTNTGRAITIIYAIFGIPMFLIILADFGKLFTRGIKFLWAFVRRLYYTGSCRTVRRTGPVQEVMKGVQLVYDFATFKRPSQINPEDIEEMQKQAQQSQTVLNLDGNVPPDTPGTPAMSTFAIDDEFNLPISVAIFILLGYIFVGATLFCLSEGWGFFESFYFVFISMSTIGFGDYVPKHPIYMMCSIIYLVFGLALTSMCINVVQVMLSDSFRQASQKIGATIGFAFAEEDRSVNPAVPPPVEVVDVHVIVKESESDEKIAPKAKQEDLDL